MEPRFPAALAIGQLGSPPGCSREGDVGSLHETWGLGPRPMTLPADAVGSARPHLSGSDRERLGFKQTPCPGFPGMSSVCERGRTAI